MSETTVQFCTASLHFLHMPTYCETFLLTRSNCCDQPFFAVNPDFYRSPLTPLKANCVFPALLVHLLSYISAPLPSSLAFFLTFLRVIPTPPFPQLFRTPQPFFLQSTVCLDTFERTVISKCA
ncbi:hypothetical protein L596_001415 [Steinernema carpocapsae]|uniref:Uncharacterized protein n=1 Tax=Steinernema carpocapsae TaxID=34508 RepID=A0A4U8UL63_STECR|nr:hypothetical protein L596_001415 [Steinernema carpocapsae]